MRSPPRITWAEAKRVARACVAHRPRSSPIVGECAVCAGQPHRHAKPNWSTPGAVVLTDLGLVRRSVHLTRRSPHEREAPQLRDDVLCHQLAKVRHPVCLLGRAGNSRALPLAWHRRPVRRCQASEFFKRHFFVQRSRSGQQSGCESKLRTRATPRPDMKGAALSVTSVEVSEQTRPRKI